MSMTTLVGYSNRLYPTFISSPLPQIARGLPTLKVVGARAPSGFSPPASSYERSQSLITSSPLPSVRQNTDNLD
nr:MAG TPA: hypothetical protein [Caudoviricetes sp.]